MSDVRTSMSDLSYMPEELVRPVGGGGSGVWLRGEEGAGVGVRRGW